MGGRLGVHTVHAQVGNVQVRGWPLDSLSCVVAGSRQPGVEVARLFAPEVAEGIADVAVAVAPILALAEHGVADGRSGSVCKEGDGALWLVSGGLADEVAEKVSVRDACRAGLKDGARVLARSGCVHGLMLHDGPGQCRARRRARGASASRRWALMRFRLRGQRIITPFSLFGRALTCGFLASANGLLRLWSRGIES